MRSYRFRRTRTSLAFILLTALMTFGSPAAAQPPEPVPWLGGLDLPKPGRPVDVEDNATIIEDHLFGPHPEEWGGMYVDGDTLVVLTVTREVREAAEELRALDVTRGIAVRQTDVSMAQLEKVTAAISADPAIRGSFTSGGPDYSQSRVVVGLESDDLAIREALARHAQTVDVVAYSAPGRPRFMSSGQVLLYSSLGAIALLTVGLAAANLSRSRRMRYVAHQ